MPSASQLFWFSLLAALICVQGSLRRRSEESTVCCSVSKKVISRTVDFNGKDGSTPCLGDFANALEECKRVFSSSQEPVYLTRLTGTSCNPSLHAPVELLTSDARIDWMFAKAVTEEEEGNPTTALCSPIKKKSEKPEQVPEDVDDPSGLSFPARLPDNGLKGKKFVNPYLQLDLSDEDLEGVSGAQYRFKFDDGVPFAIFYPANYLSPLLLNCASFKKTKLPVGTSRFLFSERPPNGQYIPSSHTELITSFNFIPSSDKNYVWTNDRRTLNIAVAEKLAKHYQESKGSLVIQPYDAACTYTTSDMVGTDLNMRIDEWGLPLPFVGHAESTRSSGLFFPDLTKGVDVSSIMVSTKPSGGWTQEGRDDEQIKKNVAKWFPDKHYDVTLLPPTSLKNSAKSILLEVFKDYVQEGEHPQCKDPSKTRYTAVFASQDSKHHIIIDGVFRVNRRVKNKITGETEKVPLYYALVRDPFLGLALAYDLDKLSPRLSGKSMISISLRPPSRFDFSGLMGVSDEEELPEKEMEPPKKIVSDEEELPKKAMEAPKKIRRAKVSRTPKKPKNKGVNLLDTSNFFIIPWGADNYKLLNEHNQCFSSKDVCLRYYDPENPVDPLNNPEPISIQHTTVNSQGNLVVIASLSRDEVMRTGDEEDEVALELEDNQIASFSYDKFTGLSMNGEPPGTKQPLATLQAGQKMSKSHQQVVFYVTPNGGGRGTYKLIADIDGEALCWSTTMKAFKVLLNWRPSAVRVIVDLTGDKQPLVATSIGISQKFRGSEVATADHFERFEYHHLLHLVKAGAEMTLIEGEKVSTPTVPIVSDLVLPMHKSSDEPVSAKKQLMVPQKVLPVPRAILPLSNLLVVFDFDMTITRAHLYYTADNYGVNMRKKDSYQELADGFTLGHKAVTFTEVLFGGRHRMARLRNLFTKLKAAGVHMMIATRGVGSFVYECLVAAEFTEFFDEDSIFDHHTKKADAVELMQSKLEIDATHTLYTDDNVEEDVPAGTVVNLACRVEDNGRNGPDPSGTCGKGGLNTEDMDTILTWATLCLPGDLGTEFSAPMRLSGLDPARVVTVYNSITKSREFVWFEQKMKKAQWQEQMGLLRGPEEAPLTLAFFLGDEGKSPIAITEEEAFRFLSDVSKEVQHLRLLIVQK